MASRIRSRGRDRMKARSFVQIVWRSTDRVQHGPPRGIEWRSPALRAAEQVAAQTGREPIDARYETVRRRKRFLDALLALGTVAAQFQHLDAKFFQRPLHPGTV